MDPMHPLDHRLLDRYLAGECSPGETATVEQWIAASPDASQIIEAARRAGGEDPVFDPLVLRQRIAHMVERETMAHAASTPSHVKIPSIVPRRPWFTRQRQLVGVAATMAVLLAVGLFPVVRGTRSLTTRTYTTPAGQRATLRLADDVRVTLGPATQLTVTTGDTKKGTSVTVQGEALFDVAHRARRPFSVHTAQTVTRVLGTTFLVRQYPGDLAARVMVAEGRVAVRAPSTGRSPVETTLPANTVGEFADSGGVTVTPNIAIEDYTGWTIGRLVFRNTPVRTILADLARTYGTDIVVADSTLGARKLTLTVPVATRSLDDVLSALVLTLDAHYTKSGQSIRVIPGRRAQMKTPLPLTTERNYGR